jgi:eukaryotic-like serine/threonine-protein kinase
MQGQTLAGRYYIVKHLGGGGFGQTYLAEDRKRSGNPSCVVKQLKPQYNDPETLRVARRLFQTEIKALHQLGTHPLIPTLLDNFEENGEFYLVQDFIDGESLSEEMTPGKRFSEVEVIAILRDIIEALVFVQQHNFIHRDIDPSNLMRRKSDGRIVLIDFGATKRIGTQIVNSGGQVPQTVAIGKLAYMPQEQKDGYPNLSTDIYAVGTIGIQALTGIFPQHLLKNTNGEISWRSQAQVSANLANILDKMVRSDFRKRYQSAAEVWQALNSLRMPSISVPAASTVVSSSPNLLTLMSNWIRDHKIDLLVGVCVPTILGVLTFFTPDLRRIMGLEPGNFASYENQENKFKMKYPDKWDKQEESNAISKEVVQFISPKEGDADKFQERVVVTVEPSGDRTLNRTLDEHTKLSKQEILKLDKNAKINQEGVFTVAGKNGYKIVYTTKSGSQELKKSEFLTLKNGKAYSLTYEAEAAKYDNFWPVVEKSIKSLEIQDTK